MKRFTAFIILFLAATLASCQVKVTVPQTVTIQWDAPIDVVALERYEVYIDTYPSGAATLVATVTVLEYTFTLAAEGDYRFGLRAIRHVAGVDTYSEYLWSSVAGVPEPWYVSYRKAAGAPQKLRVKP